MSGKTYEGCQADYSEGNIADAWFDGSCPSSYTPSSTSLQTAGEDQIILPQTGLVIRRHGPSLPIHEIRFVMVDRQGQIIQWTSLADQLLGPDSGIRCFQIWLGGQLSRCEYGWSVDRSRTGSPHQLFGTESCLFGTANILLRENRSFSALTTRQYYSDNIHKQDGRKSFLHSFRSDSGDLELVHQSLDHYSCGAPSRCTEHSSRLGESAYQGFQRLEIGQESLPMSGGEARNILNRPICLQDEQSITGVLQLEGRPSSCSNRCLVNSLDGTLSLHVPPFALISCCLTKLHKEEVSAVLIAPVWPNQTWFAQLLNSLVDLPILLPPIPQIVTNSAGQNHPLAGEGHLPLAAWPVSGEVAKQEDFLTELSTSSENLGEHQQNHPTPVPGNSGIAGALRGIPIPFQLL